MREILKYIGNLTFTIQAQNKGIRRLVRKNKRLREENAELLDMIEQYERNEANRLLLQTSREIERVTG